MGPIYITVKVNLEKRCAIHKNEYCYVYYIVIGKYSQAILICHMSER